MKKTILFALLVICGGTAYAQNAKSFYKSPYETRNSGSFDQSASIVTFSYGFPNIPVRGNYGLFVGNRSRSGFGPLYVKYEHGFLRDEVGLGIQGAISGGRVKYAGYDDGIFAIHFGVLGYYHFNKLIPIEQLDVYAGAGLGIRNVAYDGDNDNDFADDYTDTNVNLLGKLGARWYFTDKFAGYLEVGFDDMSDVNLGVSLRLQ